MSRHSIPINELHVGFGSQTGTALLSPLNNKQIKVYSMSMINRSGATCDIAILKSISSNKFKVFSYDGATVSEITTAIQGGTPSTICTTTSGSGLIIQSSKRFGFVSLGVSTAGTGSPTITLKYWNGSAFVSASSLYSQVDFSGSNAVFYINQDFNMKTDPTSFNSGLDNNMYAIQILVSGSTNSPQANSIVVGSTCEFSPQVSKNGTFSSSYDENYPLFLDGDEKIIPYFSVVSPNNMISCFYAQDN